MNSYEIIRAISAVETMTYAEKFAGAILALHLDRAKGFIKVRQSVIAEGVEQGYASMAAGIAANLRL